MSILLRVCNDQWDRINYIGYDRGCEFEPFLKNLAKKGNVAAKKLLKEFLYLVDYFHCIRHKKITCMPLENNPECLYHPRLPKFKDIWGVNTQCAEQTFSWTNKFKSIAKNMTHYKFKFFVNVVVDNKEQIS